MKIEQVSIDKLIPYARNPRKNDAAVDSVAASIKEFGFKQPIVIDAENVVVAGHTRLKAAKKLGIKEVPCLRADDLTPDQIKAYRILDNKVAEKSEWDLELLPLELSEIELDLGPFEVEFDMPDGPDFDPVSDDEQGKLDEMQKIQCPECGHWFESKA
jgi:ParB family transcriptional regulator, chromosome partitioning protein